MCNDKRMLAVFKLADAGKLPRIATAL